MFAVAACNYTCVEVLLEQGADPNARRFETGCGPLFLAAQNGDINILKLLLKYGAVLDQPNFDNASPLLVACQEGNESVVRELLGLGANPNRAMKDRATPLFIAAQNGHCMIVRLLLAKGATVDARRIDDATPLWISAQMGWADLCSCLLEHGAFVDSLRNDGASPLFKASHKGFKDAVKVLLRHKPKLGLLPNGETCLHGATMFGHLDIVKMLIKGGADWRLQNTSGETPFQIAVKFKHFHIADYLKSLSISKS